MKKSCVALLVMALGGVARADGLLITGAGATFPYPLYSKWFSDYNKEYKDRRFNYQSIGSGGGIRQISERTVDFGASDAPMTDEELSRAPGVVHIPTVMGAVVVTYNGPVQGLRLTPETLSALFLGTITKWNDPRLAKDNPGATLPDTPVTVVHRSDGSGTNSIFTDYLSKVSPEWKSKVGAGKSVKWRVGLGAKGNEGVTGLIKSTPGSVGYVELAYADQNKLPMAELKNHDGFFVKPSIGGTSDAAIGVPMPKDFRVSITDAAGKTAYPLASFTYLLVYRDQSEKAKGEALLRFLWWAIHEGQASAAALDYAPLPKKVVAMVEKTLESMTVQGKPISLASSR
ncbi:MAG TPA: phosphate ABC transporter substrate-binding protein PstS [Anaeromyxobacteraceae bacterium]|nr:phosphate ABC transporter substrate-binding protein PstS [Anaeromyxobacteraceae bacterium]